MQIKRTLSAFGIGLFMAAGMVAAPVVLTPSLAYADFAEGSAFRSIIQKQISAFQSGDAKQAFSYATPTLQKRFQTPEIFIHMVKNGYKPVYRPKNVTFGQSRETPHGPMQEVYVTDQEDQNWLAVYSFEKQPDGSWRISGCYLKKDEGISA